MTDHDDDTYTLPPADDTYWDSFIAQGLHNPTTTPTANGAGTPTGSWQPLNLADPQYAIPPDPPTILGLIYRGRRHIISGPPESAKTLIAYILLLQALRDHHTVAIIDFEMGPVACRRLLHELGATTTELAHIYYVNPTDPPPDQLQHLIQHGTTLVLIDAAIGAYDASGLDDNARKDAETFARTWIRPLWDKGATTLLIDHVTKNTDTRGKFTIGSERKLGQADVHLGCETIKALTRGGHGLVKVTVHKDRPGYLKRPTHTVIELNSDPDSHMITWNQQDVDDHTDTPDGFRPTRLMEKISRHLEDRPEPLTRNEIETDVSGKREYLRSALDHLVSEGYLLEQRGPRNARIYLSQHPFREASATSPPPRPHLAPGEDVDLAPPRPPLQGGEGEVQHAPRPAPRPRGEVNDVDDQEIQRLLDKYGDHPTP